MINRTNFEHTVIALIFMAIIGFLSGEWNWAAVVPIAIFVSREHAQYERKRKDSGEYNLLASFAFWKWGLDSTLDWVMPTVSCLGVYAAIVMKF
jgi:hypothetical protein